MTNQPCIYFKKTWKQPCYFWKHGHLFGASWQEGVTVDKEQRVCSATYCFTPDCNFRFEKASETKSATLEKPQAHPDLAMAHTRFLFRRCKSQFCLGTLPRSVVALQRAQILITIILSILFMHTSSKADSSSMPP